MISLGLGVGLSAALGPSAFADVTVVKTDSAELDLGGMVQMLGFAQHLNDPYKNDDRLYLFMNRARLRMSGRYDDISFHTEMGLGGEDAVVATTGVSLSLLDFVFDIPLVHSRTTYVKVGQFKVPYGREQLTYEANLQFADRSIDNLGFVVGRDVGVALVSRPGLLTLIGGVFTGGGRDVPPNHYLPETLGIPLFVARAGLGNVDGDPFALAQDDEGIVDHRRRGAIFVNALYTKDTLIGHSTVLNVKLADKSLLVDGDWNPYIGRAPFSQGTWWQAGADAAGRMPVRAVDLAGEAEFDFGRYSNGYGSVQMWGVRAQGGVIIRTFELAVRYACLGPDSHFSYMSVPLTSSQPIQEITPARTWFIRWQRLKLWADMLHRHPRPGLHRESTSAAMRPPICPTRRPCSRRWALRPEAPSRARTCTRRACSYRRSSERGSSAQRSTRATGARTAPPVTPPAFSRRRIALNRWTFCTRAQRSSSTISATFEGSAHREQTDVHSRLASGLANARRPSSISGRDGRAAEAALQFVLCHPCSCRWACRVRQFDVASSFTTTISTRRLLACPSAVVFAATGRSGPMPLAEILAPGTPRETR